MTPELRTAITKRNTMANISKQNPDNSDLRNEYKKFGNYLTSALRNAPLEHHSKDPANNETKLCLRCMPVICRHCRQRISVKNMPQNC